MYQNVKRNKEECVQFMENILQVLYAVTTLLMRSETGSMAPASLYHVGKFTEYLLHHMHRFDVVTEQFCAEPFTK